jgi:hypothetical protein
VKSILIRAGVFILAIPIAILMMRFLPWYVILIAIVIIDFAIYLVSVFTVQLAEACEWRGWMEGYRDL